MSFEEMKGHYPFADEDVTREALMEALLGQPYSSQRRQPWTITFCDLIIAAEGDGEDFNQRIQGLDKIGSENACNVLAAVHKLAEALENANFSVKDKKNAAVQSKQRFERAPALALKKTS